MNTWSQFLLFIFLCSQFACQGQVTSIQYCKDPQFNAQVAQYINFDVAPISVEVLKAHLDDYVILDAREPEEYTVSHIPGAYNIGFESPDFSVLENIGKDMPIVIYCSIGYRSEQLGRKIEAMGYSHVNNLYGSIFEWVNQNQTVVNDRGPTNEVHTYNKKWSRWISNKSITQIY